MRKSFRERLGESKRVKQAPSHMGVEDLLKLMLDEEDRPAAKRKINPTQAAVIVSKNFINFYKGPAGCAKTSTGVAAVLMRLITEPGSKGLIARQDYNDLKGTTLLRAISMRDRLPPGVLLDRDKQSPETWYLSPIPYRRADGTWDDRPSELRFMGLKEGLGSYDFNVAFLDEADEIAASALNQVITRMRTKSAGFYRDLPDLPTEDDPEAKDTKGYFSIYLAFNPPEKTHWLYTACTGRDYQENEVKPPMGKLFEPNPKENVQNLPANYYKNLEDTLPPDQVERYVRGEWGATFPGTPAIKTFSKAIHCRNGLEYAPGATLYRFWDFGYRHPFCLFAQVKVTGQLQFLREFTRADTGASAFAKLIKAQTAMYFGEASNVIDIGDIAVSQKKDTGSTLGELWREGIRMMYQPQTIDRGLKLLRKTFLEYIDHEPAILIDQRNCPIWVSALAGGYHMNETGAEPVKDGFYDHSMDAARYGVVGVLEPANLRTEKAPASVEYSQLHDQEVSDQ